MNNYKEPVITVSFCVLIVALIMLALFVTIKINFAISTVYGIKWAIAHLVLVALALIEKVYKLIFSR